MITESAIGAQKRRAPKIADERQIERPHVFVTKMRERPHSHHVLGTRSNPSRDLSAPDVASAYGAFEFGATFDVLLDTHVTFKLGTKSSNDPEKVQAELSAFIRCYSAWCYERLITPAWVASVEMARDHSSHAHLAVHVPGELFDRPTTIRGEFRQWVASYKKKRGLAPNAIKVRSGRKDDLLTHWIVFSYLVKGYDRSAVLRSARNCTDGRPIMLGDVIARYYRDPGPVALHRRLSISSSLGPKRREFGVPPGRECFLDRGPNWKVFNIDRHTPLTLEEKLNTQWTVPIPRPFRSKLEDGILDVRELYPPCFYEFVTKIPAANVVATPHSLSVGDANIQDEIARFAEVTEHMMDGGKLLLGAP